MEGFTAEKAAFRFHDDNGNDFDFLTSYSHERMRRLDSICVGDYQRLRRHTTKTPKFTMPAPSAFHFFRGDACRNLAVYPDIEQWWADLLSVYQLEITELNNAGCTYLQLDEVPLAMLCDPDVQRKAVEIGLTPDKLVDQYVALINQVRSYCAPEMTVAMHMCRGNFRSRWLSRGGYEALAERLFNELDINAFLLEYDSERAGDFQPLRFVPEEKTAVLGLINSKMAELESHEEIKRRIDDAAKVLPVEQLALSPQCGFASVAGGNTLNEDEQMATLRLVVEIAEAVWG